MKKKGVQTDSANSKYIIKSKFSAKNAVLIHIVLPLLGHIIGYILFGGLLALLALAIAMIPVIGPICLVIIIVSGVLGLIGDMFKFIISVIRYFKSFVAVTEVGVFGRDEDGKKFNLTFSEITDFHALAGIDIKTNIPRNRKATKFKTFYIPNVSNVEEVYEVYCAQAGITPVESEAKAE